MRAVATIVALLYASPVFAARFAVVTDQGLVVTVVEAPDAASVVVAPDRQVVEVPPGAPASTGATYANGTFTPPPVPTLTLIERKLDAAIDQNLAFLALNPPTTAQALAQVGALTRQMTGILRLMRNRLDSAD